MYPINVCSPKPADVTTTNAFNTLSPFALFHFSSFFSPRLSSASYQILGISIRRSLKGIVCNGDNESRNEQVRSNANTALPARAPLGH